MCEEKVFFPLLYSILYIGVFRVNGLKERFKILIEGGVVTPEAADIAQRAVERLTARHGRFPAEQLNMFSTHLASALTRLARVRKSIRLRRNCSRKWKRLHGFGKRSKKSTGLSAGGARLCRMRKKG